MSRREERSNVRRVLLEDQYARLAAAQGNWSLAQSYEREFADGVRYLIRYGLDTSLAPRRDVLWGSSGTSARVNQPRNIQRILPEWYVHASPICTSCSVPMIPGLTGRHRSHSASRTKLHYECRACGTLHKMEKAEKNCVPSIRSRRKDRSEILCGKHQLLSVPEREPDAKSLALHTASIPNHPTTTDPLSHPNQRDVNQKSAKAPQPLLEPMKQPRLSPPKQSPDQRRPPKSKPFSDREGLRALLQQQKKKQGSSSDTKQSTGLTDFLNQL
ncbi:hypothetical protein MYAM1_003411 [Malassezia yamatoensis]|uniref:Uncharacterized protein n=1 Tax=Malassezia yamatoensis TaxID=253288 RepID=A0AAJ5Z1N3_9BASI|nr:hypothetical protein MYAM1_003411 [Malassezia yamatoensis]